MKKLIVELHEREPGVFVTSPPESKPERKNSAKEELGWALVTASVKLFLGVLKSDRRR